MVRKTQYCQDISSFQFDLWIQHNLSENPSKLFCGHQQTDFKVYTKGKRPEISNTILKERGKVKILTLPNFSMMPQ